MRLPKRYSMAGRGLPLEEQYRLAIPHLNLLNQSTEEPELTLELALKVLANERLLREAVEAAREREEQSQS